MNAALLELITSHWAWLTFGFVLIGIEAVAPVLIFLWFGVGALVVGLLTLITPLQLSLQIVLWLTFSIIGIAFWFRYFQPRLKHRTTAGMSRESIIGEIGQVIVKPEQSRRGRLQFLTPKLGADEWEFLTQECVVLGDRVRVSDISGNTLIVTK